jgi:5-deoxy-glucuronate isomerase
MVELLIKPTGDHGTVTQVTPESAGWTYLGFEVIRLVPGESLFAETGEREACLVLISGKAAVEAGERDFGVIGERMSPFEGKPHSVYVPPGTNYLVKAETEVTLAVATAPGTRGSRPARYIDPEGLEVETRGKGRNCRAVVDILPEWNPADSLLVVEVLTEGGNSSSYPPHKHDEDLPPREGQLEAVFYHRINPAQGWVFQRVYTDDGSLDVSMAAGDGDVTLVPRGYHPIATLAGYDAYYLGVMAGPRRTWKFTTAPEHEWLYKL